MRVYKPSGIEWLGEIPQHWENVSIRSCFTESNQRCNTDSYPLLSVTIANGIIYQDNIENKKDISNDDKSNYKIVPLNAVAYNKMRMWQGAVGVNTLTTGIVSPAYIVAIPNEKILPNFVSYLFKSKIMIGEFDKNSYGLCLDMNNLRYDDFRNIKIPLPPLQEQKEIAEFLDKKCEKIQNYINKKQKLITLLQEKKQALINEAVTKGLNPSIESKNSGIEYLGLIPHHWEVRRVATLGKFFKGSNISKNDLQDSGVCVVLYGDIYTKYEIKTKQFQSKIAENFAKDKTQILCGDLLFSGSGETKEDIGKCICYLGNEKAYVGGDVIVLRQMGQDSLFLSYVLNSDYIKYQKAVISKGEIIIHIYASNLRDLKIPLPPLQEQKEIAAFLDKKCEKINSAIEKTKKQIELVKEYKNTLINEAVCGRINLERK
ncbi:restriction endonuclease subunit S [Campylobacter helveticus]|uniref:restriction endonuclease subunit S n=1 Tax=Campylobacter helveticus TaxID=28898 RepID=UPI0009C32992|nr:restriction endonuclease subunit S [Campylobacter helveticus]ARE80333.1 type I restriction/modification system, S subunit [Campylobacter helveticus]TXK54289.1 restriction endonuclease subunit S [Campylobacter helveticus]SMC22727.1 type I restriction enzyme, S subunit [Campylobacter helveticus]SUW83050.1 Type I restriction-modification system, specificity subunit S [Campylobacter helveticus]